MKYGVHYGYWAQEWDADVPALCQRAQRTGLQILEIGAACIQNKTEAELAAIRDAADRCGVELSCGMGLPVDRNIADRDPAVRSAGVQYMQEMIRRAAGAGIHKIAGILYASWFYDAKKPVYKEETRAYSIENMQQLAEYAKQYGIVLMMEVCNRFATCAVSGDLSADALRAAGVDLLLWRHEAHLYFLPMILLSYALLPVTRAFLRCTDEKTVRYALILWAFFGILLPTAKSFGWLDGFGSLIRQLPLGMPWIVARMATSAPMSPASL